MKTTETKDRMIAQIVAAYAGRTDVGADDILALFNRLNREMGDASPEEIEAAAAVPVQRAEPVIPLDQAVTQDKVFCLCCGKGFKMLKRHLGAEHGLSEAEYRAMFDLGEDVSLVAPSYSNKKAKYAKETGFGKHSRSTTGKNADLINGN